jgi:SnoaL-like domain
MDTALDARLEVHGLLVAYCRGVDRRDEHLFKSLWHDNATYDVGGQFDTYVGTEDIVNGIRTVWATFRETHHWASNISIELAGEDVATSQSNVLAHMIDNDGRFVVCAADYEDRFTRVGGRWAFERRSITIHYLRELPTTEYP